MLEERGDIYGLMNRRTIPFGVSLELTAQCNLDCQHCYHVRADGPELDTGEWRSVLDQLAALGTLDLTFTGGEPFTRRDFPDILRYSVLERGFSVKIFSNLTLLDASLADLLVSFPMNSVETTLLGADPETHDSLTRRPGSFFAVRRGIALLRERGAAVAAKTLLMRPNHTQLPAMYRLAAELGVSFRHDDGVFVESNGCRRPLALRISEPEMLRNRKKRGDAPTGKNPGSCNAAKSVMSISPDGSVYPCGPFPVLAGNIRADRLAEIWRNAPLMRRVRSLRDADYGACPDCRYETACAGCLAMGYGLSAGRMYPCRVARRRLRAFP
jgi:radical SAM protein with 4Fe4S-binding SPASM domain